jgi:hypothetical protein
MRSEIRTRKGYCLLLIQVYMCVNMYVCTCIGRMYRVCMYGFMYNICMYMCVLRTYIRGTYECMYYA